MKVKSIHFCNNKKNEEENEEESSKRIYSVITEANEFKMEFQMGVKVKHNTPTKTEKYLKKESKRKCNRPDTEMMAG